MALALVLSPGYPDHMVFSEFRRRFDVLAPHLTKKHGRNYIVVDEKRVGLGSPGSLQPPSLTQSPLPVFPRYCSGSGLQRCSQPGLEPDTTPRQCEDGSEHELQGLGRNHCDRRPKIWVSVLQEARQSH